MRADDIQPRFLQEAEGGVKSRKAGEVHRAGLQAVGEKVRHELGVAHAAGSARKKRRKKPREVFPQNDPARALRAHEALVSREGDGVDMALLHVDRENARGLRAVQKEAKAVAVAERADCVDGQQRSADVARMKAQDQLRILAHETLHRVQDQRSVRAAGNAAKAYADSFQLPQRAHDGVVLHGRHQHVVARMQKAFEQDIETRGDVRRKDHAARVLAMKERADAFARLKDELFGAVGSLIAPARDITAAGGHIPVNSLRHARGFRKAGAGVVEIDGRHTDPSFAFVLIVAAIY